VDAAPNAEYVTGKSLNAAQRHRGRKASIGFHAEPSGERNALLQAARFDGCRQHPILEDYFEGIVCSDTFKTHTGFPGHFCVSFQNVHHTGLHPLSANFTATSSCCACGFANLPVVALGLLANEVFRAIREYMVLVSAHFAVAYCISTLISPPWSLLCGGRPGDPLLCNNVGIGFVYITRRCVCGLALAFGSSFLCRFDVEQSRRNLKASRFCSPPSPLAGWNTVRARRTTQISSSACAAKRSSGSSPTRQ